jgi:hypothetical protein
MFSLRADYEEVRVEMNNRLTKTSRMCAPRVGPRERGLQLAFAENLIEVDMSPTSQKEDPAISQHPLVVTHAKVSVREVPAVLVRFFQRDNSVSYPTNHACYFTNLYFHVLLAILTGEHYGTSCSNSRSLTRVTRRRWPMKPIRRRA